MDKAHGHNRSCYYCNCQLEEDEGGYACPDCKAIVPRLEDGGGWTLRPALEKQPQAVRDERSMRLHRHEQRITSELRRLAEEVEKSGGTSGQ